MELFGYSERGFLNALFYECFHKRSDPASLIMCFLKLAKWPRLPAPPTFLETGTCSTILVEQSLSDFGDADAIILCDGTGGKDCVFLEGK